MPRGKVSFTGSAGELAGSLEEPATRPYAYALFAHCFTCGKDSAAASRISRTLAANGIAVLRFDFTGLGGSDGDFSSTGFTSNIDEAASIFQSAMHPKSFVSLDNADHLLSAVEDAQYAANTIAAWASRYLGREDAGARPDVHKGHLRVSEGNHKFLRHVASDDHTWLADEPRRAGGDNLGPDPYEHLLAALGTCTSMTIRMYATRKGWALEDLDIDLRHSRQHVTDCESCEQPEAQIDVIERVIRLEGNLSPAERARLLEIADRCPVHRTLRNEIRIDTVAEAPGSQTRE